MALGDTPTVLSPDDPAQRPGALLEREWLLTNARGGFAMGTAAGINTRRYHGLLIAALQPPVDRVVLLSQLLIRLTATRQGHTTTAELGGCLFQDENGETLIAPQGHRWLDAFSHDLTAQWQWSSGRDDPVAWRVTQRLILHDQQPAATLELKLASPDNQPFDHAALELMPLLAMRDFHSLNHHPEELHLSVEAQTPDAIIHVHRHGLTTTLACTHASFQTNRHWWHHHHYPLETRRGQDDTEHTYCPGAFVHSQDASNRLTTTLTVALGDRPAQPCTDPAPRRERITRAATALAHPAPPTAQDLRLAQAADDFVVQRERSEPTDNPPAPTAGSQPSATILAGYPWFADWGRDACIALPGLLLTTGRLEDARAVLQTFAGALRGGLIPNRFDDRDPQAASYNTVDASLWFVHACLAYHEAAEAQKTSSASEQALRDDFHNWLAPACRSVLDHYTQGTQADGHRPGQPGPSIHMDQDGLITAGDPDSQLTWMDAACGGDVFTPRHGKAVEINALWHHSLVALSHALAQDDPTTSRHYRDLAQRAAQAFIPTFYDPRQGYCVDHVTPDGYRDTSCRPNQALACSLEHTALPNDMQRRVMQTLRDRLLTPAGLRTLPVDDPNFHAWYQGPAYDRDAAYHRGTIWPWLIGPYAQGWLRAHRFSTQARQHAREAIAPLLAQITGSQGHAIHQLHEIYQAHADDQGQHAPRGCPAQAWSIAEVLRVHQMLA